MLNLPETSEPAYKPQKIIIKNNTKDHKKSYSRQVLDIVYNSAKLLFGTIITEHLYNI